MSGGRLVRVAERDRPRVSLTIDGEAVDALAGDTLLTAILTNRGHLRRAEFGDGPSPPEGLRPAGGPVPVAALRAGFCLMGACQDCWVALADGRRVRACTTEVADGMAVITEGPKPGA